MILNNRLRYKNNYLHRSTVRTVPRYDLVPVYKVSVKCVVPYCTYGTVTRIL